eukprot:377776_1
MTGPWEGYFPPTDYSNVNEYWVSSVSYDSSLNTVSFSIIESEKGAWTLGKGTVYLSNSSVIIYLDGIVGTPGVLILKGKLTNKGNCSNIIWDNKSEWTQQQFIKYIHVIHMSHLDVGYDGIKDVGYINNVLNVYFQTHLPRFVELNKAMKEMGKQRGYIYTQHPWLLWMYLDCPKDFVLNNITLQCPTQSEIKAMEDLIASGDLVWHAQSFNMQFEAMDSSTFEGNLQLSQLLSMKYGTTQSQVISNRDVPGVTRAIIPILARNNITTISIGQNGMNPAISPDDGKNYPLGYPRIFLWKDEATSTDSVVLYHPFGYGGITRYSCITVPWSQHAICVNCLGDNSGPPQSIQELMDFYTQIEYEFPGAYAFSSTFDNWMKTANIIENKNKLPQYTQEWGDQWIDGLQSDPIKMAVYRSTARAYSNCVKIGKCNFFNDTRIQYFMRYAIKPPEHTWGLPGCHNNTLWSNNDFHSEQYKLQSLINCAQSWNEQRLFIDYALKALDDHPLKQDILNDLPNLVVTGAPNLNNFQNLSNNLKQIIVCNGLSIQFDGINGKIISFNYMNREWASINNPIGYFEYITLDESDFEYMCQDYGHGCYKKPGSQKYDIRAKWYPKMSGLYLKNISNGICSIISQVTFNSTSSKLLGSASEGYLNITIINETNGNINMDIILLNKTSTLLPESMFFSFKPNIENNNENVTFNAMKLDSKIRFDNVMMNGSQYQHGIWDGIENIIYDKQNNKVIKRMMLKSLDCSLVSPITDQLPFTGWFGTPTAMPDPIAPLTNCSILGYSFNLWNNLWFTNYPLWYPFVNTWPLLGPNDNENNLKFRFQMVFN